MRLKMSHLHLLNPHLPLLCLKPARASISPLLVRWIYRLPSVRYFQPKRRFPTSPSQLIDSAPPPSFTPPSIPSPSRQQPTSLSFSSRFDGPMRVLHDLGGDDGMDLEENDPIKRQVLTFGEARRAFKLHVERTPVRTYADSRQVL